MSAPIAGVWTPWADVLCRICHEALPAEVTAAKRDIKWPGPADPTAAPGCEERREGDGPGWCTSCGRAVWVHEDIAQLTRLRAIAGGEMEQTGGMCSGLTRTRMDGGTVVVTNMDRDIVIGLYAHGVWEEGGEVTALYTLPGNTPDSAAAAVIKAVQIEAREEN